MIIVTTPMCKEIVKLAGLDNFKINKHPDKEEGDLAILLSESKVDMPSIPIKLNTFSQIKESILKVSSYFYENKIIEEKIEINDILDIFKKYEDQGCNYINFGLSIKENNHNKKVKVYSKFLKDIIQDVGCEIVQDNFDYVVFPDYLKSKVIELDLDDSNLKFIEIPTHSNTSPNPIIRANERYSILLDGL